MTPMVSETTEQGNQGAEKVLSPSPTFPAQSPGGDSLVLPPPGGAQAQPVPRSLQKEQVSQTPAPLHLQEYPMPSLSWTASPAVAWGPAGPFAKGEGMTTHTHTP